MRSQRSRPASTSWECCSWEPPLRGIISHTGKPVCANALVFLWVDALASSQARPRRRCSHLYIKTIFLPRQARDKHRESTQKRRCRWGLRRYGSQLEIEQSRRLIEYNSATSLQVTAAAMAATVWAMRNPSCGIREPEEVPHVRASSRGQPPTYFCALGACSLLT